MLKILLMTILLVSLSTGPVMAAHKTAHVQEKEQDKKEQNFADLLETLKNHPEIAAYASRVVSSKEYAQGEMGLPDPMVFLEQEEYRSKSEMGRGGGDTMVGFKQEFPSWKLRVSRSRRLETESEKNHLLQEYAYQAMKFRMIAALAEIRKIDQLEKIAAEQKRLLKTEKQSLKGSVVANQASSGTLLLADAETAEIDIMLADLGEERHEAEVMLKNMLGYTPIGVALPDMEEFSWDGNPDETYPVMIAELDIVMARKDIDMRRAEYGPNFEIQASAGRMDDGDQAGSIMAGLSIPLWAPDSQAPKLRGAKAALSAARMDQDVVRRNVVQNLTHLKAQVRTSREKIKLLRKKEDIVKESAKAVSREYEAGKTDFGMVLKAKRDAFSVQSQKIAEEARKVALIAEFNHYLRKGNEK